MYIYNWKGREEGEDPGKDGKEVERDLQVLGKGEDGEC